MRQAALVFCLLLGCGAARAAGPVAVEIRSGSPQTLAAVQSLVESPAGAGLAAEAPDLSLVRTLRADSAADLDALGPLAAYLPSDFAAQAAAAAAGDAQAGAKAVAALRQAYRDAAEVAGEVLEVRTKRLRHARIAGALEPADWRREIDELAGYAMYGGEARRGVEQWRAWEAARTGQAARAAASAQAAALSPSAAAAEGAADFAGEGPVVSLAAFQRRKAEAARMPPAARTSPASTAPARRKARGWATIPAGTQVELRLLTPLDSETARAGDTAMYEVGADLWIDGARVLREGLSVDGVVRAAEPRGRFGRPGSIEVAPIQIIASDGTPILLRGGADRVDRSRGRNVFAALALWISGAFVNVLVAPMSLWAFALLVVATGLLFVLVPGFSARPRGRVAALTKNDASVRVDAA